MMGIILGLSGECGEVQEKFKKILRDKKGEINNKDKQELIKELGDILWYVSVAADLLGSNLEEVAKTNNENLQVDSLGRLYMVAETIVSFRYFARSHPSIVPAPIHNTNLPFCVRC